MATTTSGLTNVTMAITRMSLASPSQGSSDIESDTKMFDVSNSGQLSTSTSQNSSKDLLSVAGDFFETKKAMRFPSCPEINAQSEGKEALSSSFNAARQAMELRSSSANSDDLTSETSLNSGQIGFKKYLRKRYYSEREHGLMDTGSDPNLIPASSASDEDYLVSKLSKSDINSSHPPPLKRSEGIDITSLDPFNTEMADKPFNRRSRSAETPSMHAARISVPTSGSNSVDIVLQPPSPPLKSHRKLLTHQEAMTVPPLLRAGSIWGDALPAVANQQITLHSQTPKSNDSLDIASTLSEMQPGIPPGIDCPSNYWQAFNLLMLQMKPNCDSFTYEDYLSYSHTMTMLNNQPPRPMSQPPVTSHILNPNGHSPHQSPCRSALPTPTFTFQAPLLIRQATPEKTRDESHLLLLGGSKTCPEFVCNFCGQKFNKQHVLELHISQHLPGFQCRICSMHFTNKSSLDVHMEKHVQPATGGKVGKVYFCHYCSRTFSRSDMLSRHIRVHTGVKPYSCQICGQVFSRTDHLVTHQRTHTGERPYRCPHCPYSACRRDMITRHLKVHAKRGVAITTGPNTTSSGPSSPRGAVGNAQTALLLRDEWRKRESSSSSLESSISADSMYQSERMSMSSSNFDSPLPSPNQPINRTGSTKEGHFDTLKAIGNQPGTFRSLSCNIRQEAKTEKTARFQSYDETSNRQQSTECPSIRVHLWSGSENAKKDTQASEKSDDNEVFVSNANQMAFKLLQTKKQQNFSLTSSITDTDSAISELPSQDSTLKRSNESQSPQLRQSSVPTYNSETGQNARMGFASAGSDSLPTPSSAKMQCSVPESSFLDPHRLHPSGIFPSRSSGLGSMLGSLSEDEPQAN